MALNLRYVVLHHTGVAEPHFDLMIEQTGDERLVTWRLHSWPPVQGDLAERLADHRRMYLTFEGDISGSLGHVRRVASGIGQLIAPASGSIGLRIDHATHLTLPLFGTSRITVVAIDPT